MWDYAWDRIEAGHITPFERAYYRYATGVATREGRLIDATERFRRRREAVSEDAMEETVMWGDGTQGQLF